MNLDLIANIGVAIFGITAIILVAKKNKWGFVVGLISQPFWLITSYLHQQWGVFILTVVYVFTWSYGIYEWFLKDKNNK
jgi:nicotinamide riboside transporter PnuC